MPLVEARIVRLDGPSIDVEVGGTLLEQSGAMQLSVRNTTERKRTEAALRESEERLTLAFAGAQEGVWDWNLETGAVVYSPRWKQMLGYADDEIEPHVSAWERLLHPDDRPRADELNERVVRGAADLRRGVSTPAQRWSLHARAVARVSGPPRAGRTGRAHRRDAFRSDGAEAGRGRTRPHRAARPAGLRAGGRAAADRARDARPVRRAVDDAQPQDRSLKEACGDRPDLREQVEALEAVAQQIDRDVDQLVWALRPTALDDLGLRAALANYVQDWSTRVEIAAELHTSGLLDDRLPSEAETALYRIAQEALTNVARHSRAATWKSSSSGVPTASCSSSRTTAWDSTPAASGAGSGFGLQSMQERALLVGATLEIESSPGGHDDPRANGFAHSRQRRGASGAMTKTNRPSGFCSRTITSPCGTGSSC